MTELAAMAATGVEVQLTADIAVLLAYYSRHGFQPVVARQLTRWPTAAPGKPLCREREKNLGMGCPAFALTLLLLF